MFARTLAAALAALCLTPPAAAQAPPAPPITVTVEGRGPDVVLIPGLASSRTVWADLARRLGGRYRLHLVQLAGFAGSPPVAGRTGPVAAPAADAVAAYIARQRLAAPTIIGHSLGGEVALMLGARHASSVGRLVVVDALPFYSLLMDPAATVEAVRPRADAARAAVLAMSAEASAAGAARLVRTPEARPAVIAAGAASDRATVADAVHELMTVDLRPELPRIAAPTLVLYAWDPVYGVPAAAIDATFRTAYAGLPNARLTRIDDAFHFVMLDRPDAFAAAVTAFLPPPGR